jgi:hypothetical protein
MKKMMKQLMMKKMMMKMKHEPITVEEKVEYLMKRVRKIEDRIEQLNNLIYSAEKEFHDLVEFSKRY